MDVRKRLPAPARGLASRVRRKTRDWRLEAGDAALRLRAAVLGSGSGSAAEPGRLRVLMADDLLPDPLFGAGYPRALAILRALVAKGCRVSFYPMEATEADLARMRDLFGDAVLFHASSGERGLRRLLWTRGASFDLLLVSRPASLRAVLGVRRPDNAAPLVYDAEAVNTPRERRRRALFGEPWPDDEYRAALEAELDLARTAAAVAAVGRQDAAVIGSVLDAPVIVLPHSVEERPGATPFGDRRDLLFVGRLTGSVSESPNVDSMVWFLTKVRPLLDRLIGTGYKVHVAGLTQSADVQALASDRVLLHGVVPDLDPLYDACRLFVAPTRYAAGIPLKLVEAMGRGLPCAATPLLAEQLGLVGGVLATGETPEAFAEQCRRLYLDAGAWEAARQAGLDHVRRDYSPAAFDAALDQLMRAVRIDA